MKNSRLWISLFAIGWAAYASPASAARILFVADRDADENIATVLAAEGIR